MKKKSLKKLIAMGTLFSTLTLTAGLAGPVLAEQTAPADSQAASTSAAEPAAEDSSYETEDGILSIDLPNENWKAIQDPQKWAAFSDGSNLITLEHYSNGENLPEITVADAHYVNTLTAAFSTQNEVFIATGFVTDPAVMQDVNESLLSIKVLKYDTKLAVKKDGATIGEFSVEPRDMTMYVNVGAVMLNVRSGCSVDSPIIGTLNNGASVHVTGIVKRNGVDYGWYQIAFNNGYGYVADYLSETAPAQVAPTQAPAAPASQPQSNPNLENETYLIYSQGSGRPVNITGNSGVFYDGFGSVYYAIGGGNYVDQNGDYFSTTLPASAPDEEVLGLVSDGSGRPVSVIENGDGTYSDEEGVTYYNENGTIYDEYGATYQISGANDY